MPRPNGAKIRRLRQERGLSTAELAARVGFTNEGSMRNIESRNDATAMIKLYRIARELGVAVDEIIAADDAGSPADGEPPAAVARLPATAGKRNGPAGSRGERTRPDVTIPN